MLFCIYIIALTRKPAELFNVYIYIFHKYIPINSSLPLTTPKKEPLAEYSSSGVEGGV